MLWPFVAIVESKHQGADPQVMQSTALGFCSLTCRADNHCTDSGLLITAQVVHSMLALQRATSESALARAGLGLLRSLAASNCQQAAILHYSYPSAYAESQPGPPPTDLSPELAQTISDAIASTQPEYWPRLSQHKLAAPSVSKATQEQKTRTFELQQAVQLLLVRSSSL